MGTPMSLHRVLDYRFLASIARNHYSTKPYLFVFLQFLRRVTVHDAVVVSYNKSNHLDLSLVYILL